MSSHNKNGEKETLLSFVEDTAITVTAPLLLQKLGT